MNPRLVKYVLICKLIVGRHRTCIHARIVGFSYQLEDYEFIGVITSDYGCYRPIALTILKHSYHP